MAVTLCSTYCQGFGVPLMSWRETGEELGCRLPRVLVENVDVEELGELALASQSYGIMGEA